MNTQSVINKIDELKGQPANERLLALMRLLHDKRLASYDITLPGRRTELGVDECSTSLPLISTHECFLFS